MVYSIYSLGNISDIIFLALCKVIYFSKMAAKNLVNSLSPALFIQLSWKVIIVLAYLLTKLTCFQSKFLLTLVLLNCFNRIFRHLKLELLTQFPASNDEKYDYL